MGVPKKSRATRVASDEMTLEPMGRRKRRTRLDVSECEPTCNVGPGGHGGPSGPPRSAGEPPLGTAPLLASRPVSARSRSLRRAFSLPFDPCCRFRARRENPRSSPQAEEIRFTAALLARAPREPGGFTSAPKHIVKSRNPGPPRRSNLSPKSIFLIGLRKLTPLMMCAAPSCRRCVTAPHLELGPK